ncbi:MAG: endonuclease/exonuclease/phosphatase family protein [Chloroflexota bacterium]
MRKIVPTFAFGIVFLFFIQLAGTLVESIYILDLMNSTLDEKALGVLFFFTPVLLIPFHQKSPRGLTWFSFLILLLARGLLPYLNTASRVLASGLGVFAVLSLCFLMLKAKPRGETETQNGLAGSVGLGLAVALSILLRTVAYGLDYSLIPAGGWVGWVLGLCLGWVLTQLDPRDSWPGSQGRAPSVTPSVVGIFLTLTLIWFAFSAPAVIARWTEGNYSVIVIVLSFFSTGWVLVSFAYPQFLEKVSPRGLLLWNILFTLSLTATLLAHRVPFPPAADSAPVAVTAPGLFAQILLAVMLLLFPVLFLDLRLFFGGLQQANPSPQALIPGMLLGAATMVFLIFANIFTNVWGYVEPVSPPFRGTFWLSYFLLAGILTMLAWLVKAPQAAHEAGSNVPLRWEWIILLPAFFLVTSVWALPRERIQVDSTEKTSLVVMTFNTQQSNDDFGERSFEEQLALIRRANPDILAMQETDSTRISLNNNDYVRYYAENLGYYSYFGPTTVTGTYGTAILSKYPLLNARTVFTYSDQDEVGTAEAEIEVNGRRFTIYNVHPDGSDTAMLTFAKALLERSKDKSYVIALGDYNLRDYEEAYQLVDGAFTNAWVTIYPSEISPDGVDMSGENRIDHIFVSPNLIVRSAFYVLPPESATDHPVHWADITWIEQ